MAGRKLKVFQAHFGFYDTVVAAPSQAAALRAWGAHQTLSASGAAKVCRHGGHSPSADAAAPSCWLQRPACLGADRPAENTGHTQEDSLAAKTASKPKPAKPEKPPPADRGKLDAAETALKKLDDQRKAEEADLLREADALDQRKTEAQQARMHRA